MVDMQSIISDCLVAEEEEFVPPLACIKPDDHKPLEPLLHKVWIASHVLRLDTESRFTAVVLLHRFYALSSDDPSMEDNADKKGKVRRERPKWKWVAAACLVLGCKMEETSRRLRDFINVAEMMRFSLEEEYCEAHDIDSLMPWETEPPELNEAYWKAKEAIVTTEQVVLRSLQFDTKVCHPHRLVVILLEEKSNNGTKMSEKDRLDITRRCWENINQMCFHAPVLQRRAIDLAKAAIVLASSCTSVVKAKWCDGNESLLETIEMMEPIIRCSEK